MRSSAATCEYLLVLVILEKVGPIFGMIGKDLKGLRKVGK